MSSTSLLHPPGHLPPKTALQLSQQAPQILRSSPGALTTTRLQALFEASETPELWMIYENLILSCLRTGDDKSALMCLGRLVNRFGDQNERIMALIGLVKEAEAADNAALEAVLKEYDGILAEKSTHIVRHAR
jgi:ER membrane protein complex subunit 2